MTRRTPRTSIDLLTGSPRAALFGSPRGFTIVELLIVIVVIAILAAVTIVAYNGISTRAKETALKSDLSSGAKQLQIAKTTDGSYPNNADGLQKSDSTVLSYVAGGDQYCLAGTSAGLAGVSYHVTHDGAIVDGPCPVASDGDLMQTITPLNCSTTRVRAVDARDNRTYWVQRLADGKCWMLTNLAYAGGGTNTYGDVKTLTNGTGSGTPSYTVATYYIPPGANPTTEPTAPSTSTDGTGQYGYLYNWCAAMGNQQSTAACMNTSTTPHSLAASSCPAGWRVPIGGDGTDSEFGALNSAVNNGLTNTDAGLRGTWLGQHSGYGGFSFGSQGTYGSYWSSTVDGAISARSLGFRSNFVYAVPSDYGNKNDGYAVRCVAA